MLRLTLRSGQDGRLLARIVDRDGSAFVLDFGDRDVVADASRKVRSGGFAVAWQGRSETATPAGPALLRQLALHYAARGLLVFVEEPDWPRHAHAPEDVPRPLDSGPPTLLPDEWTEGGDSDTEILSRRDLVRLKARLDEERRAHPAPEDAPPLRGTWTPPRLVALEPVPLAKLDDEEEPATEELERTEVMPRRKPKET